MSARPLPGPLALLAAAALLAPTPGLAAWPSGIGSHVPVAPAAMDQVIDNVHATASDGAGGMYVSWINENGLSEEDLYLQRFTATGSVAPGWPVAGVALCVLPQLRGPAELVPDGSGGVIAVWLDNRSGSHYDVYAQHVLASGALGSTWPANGLLISNQSQEKFSFSACTDGAGGVFVAYDLVFTPNTDLDIYASHVTGAGAFVNGSIDAPISIQDFPKAAYDGNGGCYIAFEDNLSGNFNIDVVRINTSLTPAFGIATACNAAGDQRFPQVVTLGSGSAFVQWTDAAPVLYQFQSYNTVSPTGVLGPVAGTPLYPTTSNQVLAQLVPDDAGGLFDYWVDARTTGTGSGLYLTHLGVTGAPYPGWPAGGILLRTGSGTQPWSSSVTSDGSNGAFAIWGDMSTFSGGVYASHFDAFGTFRPLSTPGGRLVYYDGAAPLALSLLADGQGGTFVALTDKRNLVHVQAVVNHLDAWLTRGDARPVSTGVRDVAADQGGHLRLGWSASWFDNSTDFGIGSYWIWRQAPLATAMRAARAGATMLGAADGVGPEAPAPVPHRLFRAASEATAGYAWEFLAAQPADASAQYSYIANTTTDSIAGHNPYTVFMVEAHALADSRAFWQSVPDSGYSVDNLPPATPAPFTGQYAAGTTTLHWNRNTEPDLAGYRLYRGATPTFTTGPGNLLASLPDSAYADAAGQPWYYALTAVDVHGNESAPARLLPQGVTGVAPGGPAELAFELASPNPARGGFTLRLALPASAPVRVAVFDAAGRHMATLAGGTLPAGEHTLAWDARDATGRPAPSGLYLVRFETPGRTQVRRVVLAR